MAGSLNSLSTENLASVSQAEFTSCQTLLGSSSNGFSAAQLVTLKATADAIYSGGVSTISDSNIASLNAIFLGYLSTELSELVFTSLSSISALGSLTGWSQDQVK